MKRAGWLLLLALTVTGCSRDGGSVPAPSSIAASAAPASREADRRGALIALASLQAAAALEANDDDKNRLREMGLFDIAARPDFPLRHEVLEHVRGWTPEVRFRALAFIRAHATMSTLYHAYVVESFGPPPSFAPRGRTPATAYNAPALATPEAVAEFSTLLNEAWTRGGVDALDAKLRPGWDALQFSPALVAEKKAAVLAYLGVEHPETLPTFNVVYDPLLRQENGYGSEPEENENLLIVGPSGDAKERELLLVHEFTHFPLKRTLAGPEAKAAILRASCADAKIGDHRSYNGFENYADETLVRAISYRVGGVPPRQTGFLFEPFFDEELRVYEAAPKRDLAAFAPRLFDDLARRYCEH
jgi:hypothetical protein